MRARSRDSFEPQRERPVIHQLSHHRQFAQDHVQDHAHVRPPPDRHQQRRGCRELCSGGATRRPIRAESSHCARARFIISTDISPGVNVVCARTRSEQHAQKTRARASLTFTRCAPARQIITLQRVVVVVVGVVVWISEYHLIALFARVARRCAHYTMRICR